MKIELPPYGSRLIVFDSSNKHDPRTPASPRTLPAPIVISQGGQEWTLRAGNEKLNLTDLADWLSLDQLKSFSGKAEYETRFNVDSDWLKAAVQVELDLGEVRDVAQVTLNGNAGPTMLLRPYVADVTTLIKPGDNVLRITVTNTWTNHLVGRGIDLSNPGGPEPQPERSGLMGPVRLVARSSTN